MTFDTLSPEEQTALFFRAGQTALNAWQSPHVALDLISLRSNAVFSATYPDFPDEMRMILRVNWPARKSLAAIRSETLWLDLLARHALPVPRVLRRPESVTVEGVTTPFFCTLFARQSGESLPPERYTSVHAEQIGRLVARLHEVRLPERARAHFARPRLDAEGIFGANSPYMPDADGQALLAPHKPVLDAVRARVEAVFARLADQPDAFGPIHGDLKPDNLLFEGDSPRLLDFDDCAWGYRLYDLAPLLLFLRLGLRGAGMDGHYTALKRALWTGYDAVRPQSEALYEALETLAMGRYAASCLWVAVHRDHPAYRGKVEGILAARAAELAAFLRA